jgi:hypothetical protein
VHNFLTKAQKEAHSRAEAIKDYRPARKAIELLIEELCKMSGTADIKEECKCVTCEQEF